jgi:phosphohistidine phosphatase
MKLYLVRHGEAKPKSEDPDRALTEKGREDVARMAAFAQRVGVQVDQIQHSDRRRAQETAAILAEALNPPKGVAVRSGVGPKDDVRPVAELLRREGRQILLVGHAPFLDRLVGLLVAGTAEQTVVQLQPGGIVCLERDPESGHWQVRWAVAPDIVP